MPETEVIRILVVDSRSVIASGIATILKGVADFEVVGQAMSGEQALRLSEQNDLDVISMDIDLLGPMQGMELIHRLRRRSPRTRIIILTNLLDAGILRSVLQEGACGYLLKSISADELVQAIRAAFEGTIVLSPEAAQSLIREPAVPNEYHLTPREYDVLHLLVQGWNNHDIAKELHISLSTVQFHVSNILEKLKVHNRIEAATLAVQRNLASYQKPLAGTTD
jgi:two-component system, NarL family, response regulator LiaR